MCRAHVDQHKIAKPFKVHDLWPIEKRNLINSELDFDRLRARSNRLQATIIAAERDVERLKNCKESVAQAIEWVINRRKEMEEASLKQLELLEDATRRAVNAAKEEISAHELDGDYRPMGHLASAIWDFNPETAENSFQLIKCDSGKSSRNEWNQLLKMRSKIDLEGHFHADYIPVKVAFDGVSVPVPGVQAEQEEAVWKLQQVAQHLEQEYNFCLAAFRRVCQKFSTNISQLDVWPCGKAELRATAKQLLFQECEGKNKSIVESLLDHLDAVVNSAYDNFEQMENLRSNNEALKKNVSRLKNRIKDKGMKTQSNYTVPTNNSQEEDCREDVLVIDTFPLGYSQTLPISATPKPGRLDQDQEASDSSADFPSLDLPMTQSAKLVFPRKSSLEIFNCETEIWTELELKRPLFLRGSVVLTLSLDDFLFCYTPQSLTKVSFSDGSSMKVALKCGKMFPGVIADSRFVYVFGGDRSRTCEKFGVQSMKPRPISDMLNIRSHFTPCFYSEKIFLCGGGTPYSEVYSPNENMCKSLKVRFPLNTFMYATMLDGVLHVIGHAKDAPYAYYGKWGVNSRDEAEVGILNGQQLTVNMCISGEFAYFLAGNSVERLNLVTLAQENFPCK